MTTPSIPPYHYCIICDRPLEPAFDLDDGRSDRDTPIYPGLHFQASGNYGSTLYDPAPDESEKYVEVVICDWCLVRKAERVQRHLRNGTVTPFAELIVDINGPGPDPGIPGVEEEQPQ